MHAIDLRTGRDRWRFDSGAAYGSDLSTTAAVLPDQTVLWPGPRDRLYALTPSGRLRWRVRYGSFVLSPLLGSDLVAVRDADSDGRERWRFRTGKLIEVSPAVAPDGTIVTGSNDRFQYGVSPGGGSG